MAAIDDTAVVKTTSGHAGRAPPKVSIPRTASSDNAGFKSFAMQNREVDTVKAATLPLAHSKSYSQFPNNDHIHKAPINGHQKDEGSSNENSNSDGGPHKTKKKGPKNRNKNAHQSNSEDRQPPASSDQPADTQPYVGGCTQRDSDPTYQNNKSRVGKKDWSGGGGAQGQGCYSCGSLGHLSRDCKLSASDADLLAFSGNPRGRGRGRGGRGGGGGHGRNNRSNTIDESHTPHNMQAQVNDGFRSVRGDPHRLYDDKAPLVPRNTTSRSTANHSSPFQNDILVYGPTPDGTAFVTPSDAWYPSHEAHAMMVQQMYGPPPQFMHQHDSQQMKWLSQASNKMLRPLPVAQTKDGQFLPPTPRERSSVQTPGDTRGTVVKVPTGVQNKPSVSSAATLVEPAQIRVSKHDSKTMNSPIKEDLPYVDARPAHIRIESVMKSIAGELEYIKTRIHPAGEHGITPEDLARYLDTCMGLCKHVLKAAADLVGENEALKKHIMPSSAKAGPIGAPSGHDNGGLKIGSTPHSRTHSRTQSNISANTVQVSKYIRPSGAQTFYPPLVPQYEGYMISKQPRARSVEN